MRPSPSPRRSFRYTAILVLTAIGTALAAVGGWRYARASAPVNGPIIVISIDSLRADRLPAYGYRGVSTPAIDALASDGVVFERAYAHTPQTLPAHVSMLSGRLPFETGVRDNVGFVVRPGERLLPQLLRERGYTTGGVVSAYLLRKETGVGQGFDFFDGEMAGQSERDGAESEAIAERWLSQQRSSRIFLFLHLYEPHAPYAPPARFADYAPYDGEIAYADDIVGRLARYLKAHQLYDQSTIVLLSDHGEGLGDHGEQEHGLFLYDEAIHVPLIVKQAAGVGAGRRVPDIAQQVDLVPTILELVKAPSPGNLRGRSLRPLLDGTGHLPEQPVYSEALYGRYRFGWSELTALTGGRYRYIKAPREELYDLERDPREGSNLADNSQPEASRSAAALRDALAEIVAGTPIQPPAGIAAAERGRLLALGYISGDADFQVGRDAGARADPKDMREIAETYRAAVALAAERKWARAISLLQGIAKSEPDGAPVWQEIAALALLLDRYDLAVDAHNHAIALDPSNAEGHLGAAAALLKLHRLDDARDRAEQAGRVASERDQHSRAAAHELLARIALARHDAEQAREEAELARQADPALPMPDVVEGRLLYDQGKYAEAVPFFDRAIAAIAQAHAQPMPDLHFYAADALARLERYAGAEPHYVDELRDFPQNTGARAGLATLYQATGRPDEASAAIADMLQVTPTPDSYALASHLWKTFGNSRQADKVRAEARRTFAEPGRAAREGVKH